MGALIRFESVLNLFSFIFRKEMFVMNEYKGNSHRSKEEASTEVVPVKKVERVATGKTRKKNEYG